MDRLWRRITYILRNFNDRMRTAGIKLDKIYVRKELDYTIEISKHWVKRFVNKQALSQTQETG